MQKTKRLAYDADGSEHVPVLLNRHSRVDRQDGDCSFLSRNHPPLTTDAASRIIQGAFRWLSLDEHRWLNSGERYSAQAGHLDEKQIRDFETRYQQILDEGYAQNPLQPLSPNAKKKRGRRKKSKPRNLLERLDEHRSEALAFMYDFNVPFDNNLAERDIRMMKVQQKISGMFRTEDGAKAFCRIRSYISTARKNTVGAMDALTRLFSGNPFVLEFDTS